MCKNYTTGAQGASYYVSRKEQLRESIGEMIVYAEKQYNCVFSKKFKKRIKDLTDVQTTVLCSKQWIKIVDALIREWNIWKPYVDVDNKDSFSMFMEDGILSMIEIDASATFYSPNIRGYIGDKVKLRDKPPVGLATSVTTRGQLFVNGRLATVV